MLNNARLKILQKTELYRSDKKKLAGKICWKMFVFFEKFGFSFSFQNSDQLFHVEK
jgi:hypothetical protein